MTARLSNLEQALRDTLIMRAPSRSIDRLAELYGLRRPDAFSAEAWRRFMRAVVWGPRGTPGCILDALEGLFWDSREVYQVTIAPGAPNTVTFVSGEEVSGESVTGWTCRHVGRLVRLEFTPGSELPVDASLFDDEIPTVSPVFWTTGPAGISGATTTATLELATVGSAYWGGAKWDGGVFEVPTTTTATLTVLPFVLREVQPGRGDDRRLDNWARPCELQILLEDTSVTVPPTYLLDPGGVDRDTVDATMPLGGILLDEFDLDGDSDGDSEPPPTEGNQETGPNPLYLVGEELVELARIVDPLLAAGCRARVVRHVFCPDT